MRVLVVLYHLGDALARAMERVGVSETDIMTWCADWEEAVSGCSSQNGLEWLRYADSLSRLVNRYHALVSAMETVNAQTSH